MSNPTRQITAGSGDSTTSVDSNALPSSFKRVIVYDTLNNLYSRTDASEQNYLSPEELAEYTEQVKIPLGFDPSLLARAPRGAILGYEITLDTPIKISEKEGASSEDYEKTKLRLYFPLFSSHFSLPVKPGEHVVVANFGSSFPVEYWITRVSEEDHIEDTNYTHGDRRFTLPGPPVQGEESDRDPVPKYNNGPTGEDDLSEEDDKPDNSLTFDSPDAYSDIREESLESKNFNIEPVPRYRKRPGDLILQGSNNSTIVLGTSRGYGSVERPNPEKSNSELSENLEHFRASVDIVTGRGRFFRVAPDSYTKDKLENDQTRPRIVENGAGEFELNKNPSVVQSEKSNENRHFDIPEGDPDFLNDASRVYITSDGEKIDELLGTMADHHPALLDMGSFAEDFGSAACIKSDRLRLVARKTRTERLGPLEPTGFPEINGDIKIIKQGDSADDECCIFLLPDGTVQISGKQIVLARSEDITQSSYGGSGPAPGGTQPYVRFSDLKKAFEETFAALDKFCTTMQTHTTPGFGAPSPQIIQAVADLKIDMEAIKGNSQNFDAFASERIFGE